MDNGPEKRVLEDMFLRDRPSKILISMKNARGKAYASILSRETGCTFSHTTKVLNLFKKMGIVSFEKKGRIKTIKLTDAGWEVAEGLDIMVRKLAEIEERTENEEQGRPAERKRPRARVKKAGKE